MLTLSLHPQMMYLHTSPETGGKTKMVFSTLEEELSEDTPEQLMDQTLIYLGSSLKSRKQSAKILMKCGQHIPIIMEAHLNWVLFPLHKGQCYEKLYVNQRFILNFDKESQGTRINFMNGHTLECSQNIKFVQKQYEKSLLILSTQNKIIQRQSLLNDYR